VSAVLASGLTSTVTDGPLAAGVAVAALVGVVGFLSPCVLPLVPGYLSYVAGLTGASGERRQGRMVGGALLFVLGFTVVFVTTGALFGTLGSSITAHQRLLEIILGAVTIVMGLAFLGWIPFLQREARIRQLPQVGLIGAPLLGLVFGLAWTPCLTPTVGAVYSLAATEQSAGRGAVLSAAYCLGLGIPFVLVALGFGWVSGALGFVRRHRRAVSQIGGILLVVIGAMLVTGAWDHLMNSLRAAVGSSGVGADL
jgi:cytochrome c-type biogenesis protein